MSMLAGPRRKQKVINLRAKNNAWSNDANKFGQKMLEKMGWSAGKGLGAKENGIVEHVVAKYKNDDRGLGFEDKNDQWTKHEDDFNALLANLSNSENNPENLHSGISLEDKSKKSKARIHYHKFTRGKDLSKYSEKDLANIFGKKTFKDTEIEELPKDDVKTTEQVFTEKGTMDDYFKSKLANLKSKSKLLDKVSNVNDEEQISDYGFKGFSNDTETTNENGSNGFGFQTFSFYGFQKGDTNELETNTENTEIMKNKKKKKSKNKEMYEIEDIVKNEIDENVGQENDSNSTEIVKKRKKKKSENKDIKEIENFNVINNDIEENRAIENEPELKIKKSKKKKYQEDSEVIEECEQPKKKKKAKNKTKDIEKEEQTIVTEEDKIPKKKKKRKNQE